MKLIWTGELNGLEDGISLLSDDLKIESSFRADHSGAAGESMEISVIRDQAGEELRISFCNGKGVIRYARKAHFFRGMGLLAEALRKKESDLLIVETPQFDTCGAMFDCSRNAVLKPESAETLLRRMALMGMNALMLYTEETYELEGEPYFGYMRGRYTAEELKRLDRYAAQLGIELIPCIQTLGHLEAFLKWEAAKPLRDTSDILLAGAEETYAFIGRMLASAADTFTSRRIHIGMDEAHGIGLGRYLERFGYRRRFDIMTEHLNRVREIAVRHGLLPMIWSDMYFRLASETGDYYDRKAVIPADVVRSLPPGVDLVYWDYYHEDPEFYTDYIRKHREFGRPPVFAGGIWTFSGFCTNYEKTFAASEAGLAACKAEGLREVLATVWLDDGAESHMYSALLGLQLYAEHAYAPAVDRERLHSRFMACTGGDAEAFRLLSALDGAPGADLHKLEPDNPAKYLLWQDPLLGLFESHMAGLDLEGHYSSLQGELRLAMEHSGPWACVFSVPEKLSGVLALKCGLAARLQEAYRQRNMSELKQMVLYTLPELYERVSQLRTEHRERWMETYKPFGWEVLDLRYGGMLARIDSAMDRIGRFLSGSLQIIEELEETRLDYEGLKRRTPGDGLGRNNRYRRIVTANVL